MRTTFILMLFAFAANLNSQVRFAPVGAEWRLGEWRDCNETSTDWCSYVNCQYVYKIAKVTSEVIVDGKLCSMLSLYVASNESEMEMHSQHDSILIWQDLHKIYFQHQDSFYLMLDFSLKSGDTLHYHTPPYFSDFAMNWQGGYTPFSNDVIERQIIVDTTDTIDLNGVSRKQIIYEWPMEPDPNVLHSSIDGIGNISGFFGEPHYVTASGIALGFICYRDNDIMYSRLNCDECKLPDLMTATEDTKQEQLKIFPNPFIDQLVIDTEIQNLKLFNIQGRQVEIDLKSGTNDVSQLAAGVYFLRSADDAFLIQKLIKL